MMPTTRAASTPSRRAMRKAASKKSPVENHLQLQIQVYLSLPASVKPHSPPISSRTMMVRRASHSSTNTSSPHLPPSLSPRSPLSPPPPPHPTPPPPPPTPSPPHTP